MTNKTIAPHVASFLSAALAVFTLIHPGFKVPSATVGIISTLCIIISAGIQVFHTLQHESNKARVIAAESYAKTVAQLTVNNVEHFPAPTTAPAPAQN